MACTQVTQPDIEKLQTQVEKLTEENEKLKLQVKSKHTSQSADKACTKCEDYTRRIASFKKELESSKEKAKEDNYNNKLEVEMQESNFNTETSLLRRKEESMSRLISIQEVDILTVEKKLKLKNQLIFDLEQNIRKLTLKVSDLQDNIFKTKCQSFINGEEFQTLNKKKRGHLKNGESLTEQATNALTVTEEGSRRNISEVVIQPKTAQSAEPNGESEIEEAKQQNENKDTVAIDPREKSQIKVEVIGTSNTKHLRAAYIGGKDFHVNKVLKYTIKQTKDYVESMKATNAPDITVL